MTELSKLLPVVFTTVQLAALLIVPVSQVVAAHGAPERAEKKQTWSRLRRTKSTNGEKLSQL